MVQAPTTVTPRNQAEDVPIQGNTNDEGTQKCIEVHGSNSDEDYYDMDVDYTV